MQNRQGYCSYCCVRYNNLEQHMSSPQHRYLTTQNRQRMGTSSLMERFLQDVLRHHPYHYQESRSRQNERLLRNNVSPSEVVPIDDSVSEDMADNTAGVGERATKNVEPIEELYSRPSKSQECKQGVSFRPSVIQKLEKGQQQPLKFFYKIGSGLKEFNPVGIGKATNNGKNLLCPSVISTASASRLPGRSYVQPVITNTTRLPPHLDSVNKCDPNKVDRYLEQQDRGCRNPMLSSHLETSSVLYQKPKESNRKSVCINSDKLIIQEDVKSRGKTLSTGFKSHAFMSTEGSLKYKSLSKLAVNPAINLNKTDMPSNKGIFEDAIPKHHEKFFPNMDSTQEEKQLVFNRPASLEQKSSVSSKMDFACGSPQSLSDQPETAVQDLWREEQIEQEDKSYESRGSEMSFDCRSSFYSLTDQSKMTAKETNLSKEVHAYLQHKNNNSCISEISSDCDGPLQLATNRTQVIMKGISVQKAVHVRLVDESYDSSDSEMNFDCDTSYQPTDDHPQQPAIEEDHPKEAHIDLVDKNYGSSSSEISADSVLPFQSAIDRLPVAVTETELQKKVHIGLVDMNYGSSCSETSFDCDVSLQSVIVHPQMAVKEGNLIGSHVHLKDSYKPSSAEAHLDCGISLETVTDEPQRAVEEINLPKEKNDLVDMNYDYYSPEMSFHTDAKLVADQPQVAIPEVNPQEVAIDLQNKSAKSSVSDLSFNSCASLCQSANERPLEALSEINLKELNVDMEVKSYGCSSSELTFDSDPPLLSVTEHSELNVEEIRKKHINLEHESYGSNSSEITFDSDIPLCSVVDPSEVAEEEPIDQVYKSNESCVSETTFDSEIPLPSGTDKPGVSVKELIIQKENYVHLGRKNDEPSSSEISLDSYVPPLSVTNSPGVLVKRLNLQKEEQIHFESKENEPNDSELVLNYDSFHSIIVHSEDLIKEVNLQKEEHVQLENKTNGPIVPEISLKSYISHLVTDHPDRAVKEINHQKEERINLEDKGNELSVSETRLDFGIPLQSVIQRTDVVLKEMWLQKEKHAKFRGKSPEFSGSEINLDSDVFHYSVTEPEIAVKEINVQKEDYVSENKSDKYSGSEIILDSDVLPQLMTEKPQIAVLKEDHVDPEDESTESRNFEINLERDPPRPSVIEKSQLALLKEKHVALEDKNSESSDCKVNFESDDPLQPLNEQFQEVIKKTNLWKAEDIHLENKVDKPNDSKLIQDSDVSPQSVPDQPEAAVKQTNLENEGHVYLEDNNSQYSGSEMSLDSDFLVQPTVDESQITILEKEHIELEDKHNKYCGSEISFDSDDPLQSVAEQVRETVKEISLWKDEVDVEEKRDKSKGFEIIYDSDVLFQSVAGQTEDIVKEINLWKKSVDLEGKIVEPSDSKINFDSNESFHSVTNEIQEATTEINILREEHVCLHDKGFEPNGSEVIYVSNVPLQSAVEQPHILEEEPANLEDKSNDLCGPEISFACDDPLQSVTDQLEKTVKVNIWKEDCIYLGDKGYKLGNFEISCDSDVPVQLVVGQSPVAVKQIDLEKKGHNDLENKNYEPSVSEIKCDSGIHLQLEVDQPQMVCKEMNLQRVALLGMEEKTSDSEIMSESDVPLQIVVNELQVSVKEANLQKMLFVDLVTSDSECEMIADSDIPCQPVINSPQVTVEGIDYINAKSFNLEGECYDCCDSEQGYVCEASPRSISNQSRKTFKVVNQKKDYIILEESACESYGSEINFQIDACHQSMTCQSPGSDKKMVKYIDPEDKSCEYNSPKRNFKWEDASQPATYQLHKTDKEDNFCKDLEATGLKDKSCECSVSTTYCSASPESAILQMADEDNLLKSKHTNPESKSCEPCGSGVNFQCDISLHSDTDESQGAVKKMFYDVKKVSHDSHSSSVPKVDSVRNLKKAKGIIEDNTDEPVLEALPHVPPSFVGKTWSQIMREDDMKINALVKEFKEGRFHCYFDDDCETRKVKKKNLSEEKKITSADLNDTAFIQVLLDCDYNIDDFSVALDKPSHHPIEKRPYEQTWRVASRCQAVKVSHGTQTNLTSYLVTKSISGQEEDSPTLKRLLLHNDKKPKKKIEIGTVEFLESYANILKPLHPNALVYVLSSNIKLKEGESFNFSKIRHHNDKNNQDFSIQYKYKQGSFNYYDPLHKQLVINPLNIELPESDRNNWVQIHFSNLNSSTDDSAHVQSSTSPFMTVSLRHELLSHQEASGSSVFLTKSEILNSSEVLKEGNFQLTLLNGDAAEISPKSVRNKYLESKKKVQRRKVTTNKKPDLLKKVSRPVILQQKTRITSEKQSIWIPTKLNDIIRKYISKYSVFLRHKYQSRRAFIGIHLKKTKSVVSRLKKAKRPAKMLSNSVPSAGAEERPGAVKGSSPKQRVQDSSSISGTKRNGNKKRPRKKKRKSPKPVRIYDLRSLYSQVPYSDRMMTRLLHKMLLSKTN
ncbi:DBF4-type zinc finger-containing protein 2 [Molossus molossus]|uniref:Zinc finger DBF-type containing 2 n=1 Tax=Molossus molossus TaxID=27622 RepID=A0A7J8FUN9_MOLMO|nr:DBF4-type zinc finger-containing protein 2 [Molossus molossus]KAF6451427.1 zinc finger DBF-type containing 2 [Molossus molossus]